MAIQGIKRITDLDLRERSLFLRLDLNVPLAKNSDGTFEIEDDNRIVQALPTVKYAIEQGAKVVIASHLGRPKGEKKPEFSLEPVASALAHHLGQEVTLADDCIGEGIELMARNLKGGEVLLLENLRFHKGEEKNDSEFVQSLDRIAEVYVTDAFGTAHRKHASTYGLPASKEDRGMGFLIEKELEHFTPLLKNPAKPFVTILGGAKVSDKIKTISKLMITVDKILVGGLMAYAFLKAKGETIPEGGREPADEDVTAAKTLLSEARARKVDLFITQDSVEGCDIGPKTIETFCRELETAKTVFWNGPLGKFEDPKFAEGSHAVARFLAKTDAKCLVGGGDTVSAINMFGLSDEFDHLSTGGGAVLEYLEGNGLPGIDILKTDQRRRAFDLGPLEESES